MPVDLFQELDEILLNHFIYEGYMDLTTEFIKESDFDYNKIKEINNYFQSTELELRYQLRKLIEDGKITEAINILNNFNIEILTNKSFIILLNSHMAKELIFEKKYEEALKILTENKDISDNEVTDILISMVFEDSIDILKERKKLASEFNYVINKELDVTDKLDNVFEVVEGMSDI